MDFKQIELAIELAQTLNYRKTAENHFISQPSLTYQIKRLESEIGVPLFKRSSTGVSLTTAGAAFCQGMLPVLEQTRQILTDVRNCSSSYSDMIRVGLNGRRHRAAFVEIARRFSEQHPDVFLNLIDIPGYFDFAGEQSGPLTVCEGAIITVGAVSGLNVGAEKAWAMCDKTHTSRMIVINQMDRENANFEKALATITEKYGSHIAPIEVPIVENGKFTGVVCVLENKAFIGEGKTLKEIAIPDSVADEVESAREAIMEAAAGAEDELMEKFFEDGELSFEDMMQRYKQSSEEKMSDIKRGFEAKRGTSGRRSGR